MYMVTKEIHFCYGHRLLNYDGPCAHLHGHNGRIHVELAVEDLDSRGMVVDFAEIQCVIKSWIDRTLDHTLILHKSDPLVPILREKNERFYTLDSNPTAEAIARFIYDYAVAEGFPVKRVTLWETHTSFATYSGT